MHNHPQPGSPLRVLIIGAGFAGLGLAIQLHKAGISDFLIVEKASEVGGTWRDNQYPGAACDVPAHLYSFSFELKADWSRKFAPQAEICAYLTHCAEKYGLRQRIRFNSEVTGAAFDQRAGRWRVRVSDGTSFSAQALVSACGQLNRPAYPRLPGLEQFQGEVFHSARWKHDYDLRGKRVAVIGTGASAIQFVPAIVPQVQRLYVFQRSAAYVLAKPDRAYRAWEVALRRRWPWLQKLTRVRTYLQYEARVLAFSTCPLLMRVMQLAFRRHLARGMQEAGVRQQLTPDYPPGCKRILLSNDYYPALARPHVEVITAGIRAVTATSVVTADGRECAVDAIICGTGFAATDFLAPMQITGLDGRELHQAWRDGAEAYKGISVHGFPNLFLLYGPNTNLGHNSIVYMLESQFAYVVGCLQALREHGLRYLDVKPQVQQAYNQQVQQALRQSVWHQGCTSWYKTAAGKNTNNWPGFTFLYRQHTRHPELTDYDCTR